MKRNIKTNCKHLYESKDEDLNPTRTNSIVTTAKKNNKIQVLIFPFHIQT